MYIELTAENKKGNATLTWKRTYPGPFNSRWEYSDFKGLVLDAIAEFTAEHPDFGVLKMCADAGQSDYPLDKHSRHGRCCEASISASRHIWALVSGLPGEKRRRRQLLMMQAYIDESVADGRVLAMAGYIAPAETWAMFSDEWQRFLDMNPRLQYFKMAEMAQRDGGIERSSWFYCHGIEPFVSAAVSCVIHIDELRTAVRAFDWPNRLQEVERLENPYYFAFKVIVNRLSQDRNYLRLTEPIDFIFDDKSEKKPIREAWETLKTKGVSHLPELLGDDPCFKDEKKVLPLQAADLYAWWVRHWEEEGVKDGVEHLRFAWKARRDIPRIEYRYTEKEHFLQEFQKIVTPIDQLFAEADQILKTLRQMNDPRFQFIVEFLRKMKGP